MSETEYRQDWGIWTRGQPALVGGDVIRLEVGSLASYRVADEPDLLFDLAYLGDVQDAVVFARRYGLVNGEREERWSAWEPHVARLKVQVLALHDAQALRAGRLPVSESQERWGAIVRNWLAQLAQQGWDQPDGDFPALLAEYVAWHVNGWLAVNRAAARLTVTDDGFASATDADSLFGYAYHRLAALAVAGTDLARCIQCGRVFARRHRNEKYHDALCAQRARAQRYYRKSKGGTRS